MSDVFLSPQAFSERWSLATQTLSQWRWASKGPKYIKMGRRILYPLHEVKAFEKSMMRKSTVHSSFV